MNTLIENQPILKDFHTFLQYIEGQKGVEVTNTKQVPKTVSLLEINEQIHFKAPFVTNKSKLQRFSLLNTFFYIAKTSELIYTRKQKSKFLLLVDAEKVNQFRTYNTDEQYFFLLESFWCYIDWETAYDNRSFWDRQFYDSLLKQEVGQWVTVADRNLKRKGKLQRPVYTIIAEVFAAFGFFELVWDTNLEERPDRYTFPYASVALTALGKNVLPILMDERPTYQWQGLNGHVDEEISSRLKAFYKDYEPPFGAFNPVLSAGNEEINEEEQQEGEEFIDAFIAKIPTLSVEKSWYPIQRSRLNGQFTLRVALSGKLYRDVVVPSQMTLEDLHDIIQDIFAFDNDHLFAFYMDSSRSESQIYSDPRAYDGYGLPASIIELGELGWYEGKKFTYLFDFGASWEFSVTV